MVCGGKKARENRRGMVPLECVGVERRVAAGPLECVGVERRAAINQAAKQNYTHRLTGIASADRRK